MQGFSTEHLKNMLNKRKECCINMCIYIQRNVEQILPQNETLLQLKQIISSIFAYLYFRALLLQSL